MNFTLPKDFNKLLSKTAYAREIGGDSERNKIDFDVVTGSGFSFEPSPRTIEEYYHLGCQHEEENSKIDACGFFLLAAEQGHVDACYRLALLYLSGIQKNTNAADQDHIDACYQLDLPYLSDIPKNIKAAVSHFKKAADQGHIDACYQLALLYLSGTQKNTEAAVSYFEKAADQGHIDACYQLGKYHFKVKGPNLMAKIKAIQYYRTAAKRGHAEAKAALTVCYTNLLINDYAHEQFKNARSEESEGDPNRRASNYKNAADCGHPDAAYQYAIYCKNGIGVDENIAEAAKYYELAADLGHPEAAYQYAMCCENETGVNKNMGEAAKYYKLAADCRHVEAAYQYAMCCENETGVNRNMVEAAKYYKLAADCGHPEAAYQYAMCCENETGVNRNMVEAAKYYRLAADKRHITAAYCYAMCCENGWGISDGTFDAPNYDKYYRFAARKGHTDAQYRLAKYLYKSAENLGEAIHFCNKAIEKGHPSATTLLQQLNDLKSRETTQRKRPLPDEGSPYGGRQSNAWQPRRHFVAGSGSPALFTPSRIDGTSKNSGKGTDTSRGNPPQQSSKHY